jgi:hypothetical protein
MNMQRGGYFGITQKCDQSREAESMKIHLTGRCAGSFAAIILSGCFVASGSRADDADRQTADNRADIGFAVAEKQGISLDHSNVSLGLGSYLVTITGCNDCHTWPNYTATGNPFLRQPAQINLPVYLAGGRIFALPTENVCSANITPAPDTGNPAGLTRGDFLNVMQNGCDPQEANFHDPETCSLLQVMPWPDFSSLPKRDLNAIYNYLKALPHAEPGAQAQCVPNPQGVAAQ